MRKQRRLRHQLRTKSCRILTFKQINSFDCGVFLCTYALYLAENTAFDFTQDDMPSIRKYDISITKYDTSIT